MPISIARGTRVGFAFLALAASVAASAATLTDSFTIANSKTDWTKGAQLLRFDGSLGTLTAVTFTFGGTVTSDVTYSVRAGASGTTATTTVEGHLKMAESTSTLSNLLTTATQTNVQALASGQTKLVTGITGSNSTSFNLSSSQFAFVTGTSKMSFNITAEDFSDTQDTNGNSSAAYNTFASAYGTVTYTYSSRLSSVPAPGAASMMLVSATSLLRRRRKARAQK